MFHLKSKNLVFQFDLSDPGITCAVVFGVCFGLVPFSQCVGYWIYTFKYFILTKYRNQHKYGSDEQLAQHKYSGFGEKYANAAPIVSPKVRL